MFPSLLKQHNQIISGYTLVSALENTINYANNLLAVRRRCWELLTDIYDIRWHIVQTLDYLKYITYN